MTIGAPKSRRHALMIGGGLAALASPAMSQAVSSRPIDAQPNINVKSFPYNAKGNGIADDTAAIQAAINASVTLGIYLVYFPASIYMISNTLTIPLGVSIVGLFSGNDIQGLQESVIRAKTGFPVTSVMISFTPSWCARFENLVIDCNNVANGGVVQIDCRCSVNRNIFVLNIAFNASGNNYGWLASAQTISFGENLYQNIIISQFYIAAGVNGFVAIGILNVGSFTENVFQNCLFGGGPNANACALATMCDNNYFYGCQFGVIGAAPNGALQLNEQNDTIHGVAENYFFGCTFVVSSGPAVTCKFNQGHNTFFGCYFASVTAETPYFIGTQGQLNFRSCTINDQLVGPSVTLSPGASPWTYINNNPFPVQFMFWGNVTALSFSRNGTLGGIGTGDGLGPYVFVLEPCVDGMKITYTGALTAVIFPMA